MSMQIKNQIGAHQWTMNLIGILFSCENDEET